MWRSVPLLHDAQQLRGVVARLHKAVQDVGDLQVFESGGSRDDSCFHFGTDTGLQGAPHLPEGVHHVGNRLQAQEETIDLLQQHTLLAKDAGKGVQHVGD